MSLAVFSVAFLQKFLLQMGNKTCDRLEENVAGKNYPKRNPLGTEHKLMSARNRILKGLGLLKSPINHMRRQGEVTVGGKILPFC